jgi:hypothetical protein
MATDPAPSFICPECGRRFTQAKWLGAHRWRVHNVPGKSKSAKRRENRRPIPDQVRVEVSDQGETILTLQGEPLVEEKEFSDEEFAPIISIIDRMIEENESEFLKAEKHYKEVAAKLRKLREMRRAAIPEAVSIVPATHAAVSVLRAPRDKFKTRGRGGKGASPRAKQLVLDMLASGSQMTVTEMCVGADVSNKVISSAVAELREAGQIRLVGQRKIGVRQVPAPLYMLSSNGAQ